MNKNTRVYDVVVVGSGAAGGMAAHVLTKAGVKVLMLESGRDYDPIKETPMFQTYADAPLRGAATPEKPMDFFAAGVGGWTLPNEPYVVHNRASRTWVDAAVDDRYQTDQNWMWWRTRMLGGRTNQWGRLSPRMGPYDFKPYSRDGLGFDWPISYEEVAPYYDRVEELIGVFGSKDGLKNNPDSDFFQPPPAPRAYELLLKRAGERLGVPVVAARRAVLTQPLNGRAACFYATACTRGCSIRATFQSTTVLIPPALETGNLKIVTDAHVREVTLDQQGRANGVLYIDKKTGREQRVAARAVVLGASTCETTRILLNSRSVRHPQGLGNSAGQLGRWLTDSTGTMIRGHIPALENLPLHNEDGVSLPHLHAPWTVERQRKASAAGVPRGFYISWGGGRSMPRLGTTDTLLGFAGNAWGSKLKADLRRTFGSPVMLDVRGEMIPNKESFCELDPEQKDKWGVPVLRFHFKWGEAELKQALYAQRACAEMLEAAGGRLLAPLAEKGQDAITAGGSVNHELGSTRMSARAEEGVTNSWGQLWDCPNVVVADGGVFVSNPEKNPTLTILALAWRAAEHLVDESKRQTLG